MRAITLAVLLLVLLVPLVPLSRADDWRDGTRRLDVDTRTDGFELRSERTLEGARDRIRLRLEGDNVRFRFEFQRDATGTSVDAELRVELERVIEFRDLDADAAFQETDDLRVDYGPSDLVLGGVTAENISAAGVPGLRVTADYAFRSIPASNLTFRVAAFGDLTSFQGLVQHPVEIKADIMFSGFPFSEAGTLPGIVFRVRAATPAAPNITADGVSVEIDGLRASFRWKDTAIVDGNSTRVGVTVLENQGAGGERNLTVAFAYARGTTIVHDPTFGFLEIVAGGVVQILGNPMFYAIGATAAAAVFGGLAIARKGRKVKRE